MGILDAVEGLASGLSDVTDEDHVEDALDSAEDLMDEVGGIADDIAGATQALGGGSTFAPATSGFADKLGKATGALDSAKNFVDGLFGEQDRPALLPMVSWEFVKTKQGKSFQDNDLLSVSGLSQAVGGLGGLEHMADNAIGMLGGPSGLVKSGAAAIGDIFGGPGSKPARPDWWVHEFHCVEGINELFETTVLLVRREGGGNIAAGAGPLNAMDGVLQRGQPGGYDIGEALASATKIERDIESAFKKGPGSSQSLLDDVTEHADPDADFWDYDALSDGSHGVLDPDDFVGWTCTVHTKRTMDDDKALTERWFTGVCTEFEDLGYLSGGSSGNIRQIRLVVRPSLWNLGLRKNCRIFQNMNAIAIIRKIFGFANVYQGKNLLTVPPSKVPGLPFKKDEDDWMPKREYCVQYNETDLEFVYRLMVEEGISFHFDHQDSAERIVLLDNAKASPRKCKTIDGKPTTVVIAGFVGSDGLEHVWNYGRRNRLTPTRVTVRDFNISVPDSATEALFGTSPVAALTNPSLNSIGDALGGLVAKAAGGSGSANDYGIDAEHYEYPGRFVIERKSDGVDHVEYKPYSGANVAKFYNKMYRGEAERCEASSNLLDLTAGGSLRLALAPPNLAGNQGPAQYRSDRAARKAKKGEKLILTRVVHTGVGMPDAGEDPARVAPNYYNRFEAIVSTATPYKPLPRPPKPVIGGVQSATVVDPHGSDGKSASAAGVDATSSKAAVCDELGRVCVKFHWDRRDGATPDNADVVPGTAASAYVRVAQGVAGAHWGIQFVPRIGMEVAVGFLDGDPDRPLILGALYSRAHMPPFTTGKPEHFAYSGIVTRSYAADAVAPAPDKSRHNHLIFNDAAGGEEIQLFAQRALREQVLGDYVALIGKDVNNNVKGDQSEDVLRDQFVQIGGVISAGVSGSSNGAAPPAGGGSATQAGGASSGNANEVSVPPGVSVWKSVVGKETIDVGSGVQPAADKEAIPEVVRDVTISGDESLETQGVKDPERGNRTTTIGEWETLMIDGAIADKDKGLAPPRSIRLHVAGHNKVSVVKDDRAQDRIVVDGNRDVTVEEDFVVKAGTMTLGTEDEAGGTGVHSTPHGARLDAQSRLRVSSKAEINLQSDFQLPGDVVSSAGQDALKGISVSGKTSVQVCAGDTDGHVSVVLDEAAKYVHLRGREHGVRLAWKDDVYLEITPSAFNLVAGTSHVKVSGDEHGYQMHVVAGGGSGTLDFAFKEQMHVDALTEAHFGDVPAEDPSNPNPVKSATLLTEESTDPNAKTEAKWNYDYHHGDNVGTGADADRTRAHFDDGSGADKKYAPPPEGTKSAGADVAPEVHSGEAPGGATPGNPPAGPKDK